MASTKPTPTPAPASTTSSFSTAKANGEPPQANRLSVRPKGEPLTAVRVRAASVVDLVDGRKLPALDGDWLITRGAQVLQVVAADQLTGYYDVLQEGGLTLPPGICSQLAARLGPSALATPDALVAAVDRLARIAIGEVEVRFTPGQLEELAFRAAKRGHSVQQEIAAVVQRIEEELFWGTRSGQAIGGGV